MALGSKNRDYKSSNKRISRRLQRHLDRMNDLIANGMDAKEASKQAYREIILKEAQ